MSEEKIIKDILDLAKILDKTCESGRSKESDKIRAFVDLYNKEKEKNKVIEIYRKDMPEDTKLIIMRKEDFDRNFSSEYIHKDEIKYYYKKICASVNHFQSKDNNNIVLRVKKYLQELLEERN